ncbi:hypothetical protein L8W69_06470 [Campylobacter sp. CNRCH_2016_3089]|uniref:hypothetical protein n=1 Tax=Campylobacter sp. CNRCH_2016_3089 TaxID=2911609 RepID=UPI0017CB7EB0|nr:hypothetical protein [Campylobacter sp. CNRCH_2016_3089]EAJ6150332.1 hypothetical protein [Campylobacter lari]MCV3508861.1 hypothetical protein [Campylobacter sp. CNRCH_2016_3089]
MKIRDLIKDGEHSIYYVDGKVSSTRKILKKNLAIKEIKSYINTNKDVIIDLMRGIFNNISSSYNVYMNNSEVIFSITLNKDMSDSTKALENKAKNAIIFDMSRYFLPMKMYVNIPNCVSYEFLENIVRRRIFIFTGEFLNLSLQNQ